MKRVVIVTLLLAIVATVAAGCAGELPADVAKAFYRAGNEGNYAKAESYLAAEARMAFEMVPMMGRFDNAMDAVTRGGTITRIEVEEGVEYAGAFATVMVTLHYADGSQESDVLQLVKQDGKWRISQSSLLMKGAVRLP